MDKNNFEGLSLKLLERIQLDLREIEPICSDYFVNERIHKILEYIEKETIDNKIVLAELIKERIKETRSFNSELNTSFYFLYRNFSEGKISIRDAQSMYDMYVKELRNS